ncbi:luciferase-like protein [Novosphingobium aromaticivorans DSM 12444]|uniref:Luciferase-like monooxygenase n=1 Tax=Novosphingobium aromaticivorans (strain ATCC 700278 / DSM 12444 / CCUG 56034 / CIP 105152 / NBRC 16084 / F199) TaxID=279238 RepID=Q2GBW5_NOVAD|nr:LLM class flavin-dependent oxidoreductase [Novosphingobium aromaticivorans]ABD24658.1 luciferase-like protein [Novosphingobium aromaticivorans DSM 12444]SCY21488.1 luciferase family oxidoreductase, group 1 [Novosphingobium aromaticivorans]
MKLSVLDLVSVVEGGTVREALDNSAAAARVAEECGYQRYWVAEHHGMEGIASAAVAVTLAHIGHATSTIRIGAGGIMLPNHNPLVIAEQFGTLDALFPGRIDLGLGRAPGADQRIVRALRKDTNRAAEDFPADVVELQLQFAGDPRVPLQAVPGKGARPQMWILGSSLFGAQLAAMLGLPYAFASHFAPDHLDAALKIYRERFQPSDVLDAPYCAAAINAVAAETDEEATLLASSMDQAFVALRTGNPGKLKPPVPGYRDSLPPPALAMLEHVRQVSATGSVETVRRGLKAFVERTGVDEVIVAASIFDQEARRRSLRLVAEAARETVTT